MDSEKEAQALEDFEQDQDDLEDPRPSTGQSTPLS